jgi:transcriptional regulator with XRE-family HTH domain
LSEGRTSEKQKGGQKVRFDNIELKSLIIRKYGTQGKFAEALGVTEVTVNNKLNGKSQLKLDEIDQWAKLLEVPVEDIGRVFLRRES